MTQAGCHHRYDMGAVLGAGSFGVVREAIERSGLQRRYACKTVPKVPKRGVGTPRYLLKLQSEVDVMRQLGSSLDAVFLKACYPPHRLLVDAAPSKLWSHSLAASLHQLHLALSYLGGDAGAQACWDAG